jgi:hypothetical protein
MRMVISMLAEDGKVTELAIVPLSRESQTLEKYTAADCRKIDQCNAALEQHDLLAMTEEENDWMLDPTGLRWKPVIKTSPEEFERLAGFTVEKTIKYHDDHKS